MELTPETPPQAAPDDETRTPGSQENHRAGLSKTRTAPGAHRLDRGSIPGPAAAGGPRGPFASDPRKAIWIRRAVASAVGGIIITVLADWRFGLTAAVLIAIADTIHRSQTSEALPAAVTAPSAHRRTRRRLDRLHWAGYRTLHARAATGSKCVIDHLVIGPGGVYSVDSQRWDRRLPVRASKGGKLYHGPFSQADRLTHALSAADEASRQVSVALGENVAVQPIMVIYGPPVPWAVANVGGVDVLCARWLRKYLRQHAKSARQARLGSGEIERIHAAAARVLPPVR